MKVRRFDPDDDLIIVKARVFGKHGDRIPNLALDTAASHTDTVDDGDLHAAVLPRQRTNR